MLLRDKKGYSICSRVKAELFYDKEYLDGGSYRLIREIIKVIFSVSFKATWKFRKEVKLFKYCEVSGIGVGNIKSVLSRKEVNNES